MTGLLAQSVINKIIIHVNNNYYLIYNQLNNSTVTDRTCFNYGGKEASPGFKSWPMEGVVFVGLEFSAFLCLFIISVLVFCLSTFVH